MSVRARRQYETYDSLLHNYGYKIKNERETLSDTMRRRRRRRRYDDEESDAEPLRKRVKNEYRSDVVDEVRLTSIRFSNTSYACELIMLRCPYRINTKQIIRSIEITAKRSSHVYYQ